MLAFMGRLESRGTHAVVSVFLDTFLDTPSMTLTGNEMRVRDRDGKLSMSISISHHPLPPLDYYLTTDVPGIVEAIRNAIDPLGESSLSSPLRGGGDGGERREKKRLRQWIETNLPKTIASLPTLRYSYSLGDDDDDDGNNSDDSITVNVDTLVIGDQMKMTIGAICGRDPAKMQNLISSAGLADLIVRPVPDKLTTIFRHYEDDAEEEEEEVLQSSATSEPFLVPEERRTLGDCILASGREDANFPWVAFPAAVELAVGACIPLRMAFQYCRDLVDI
ncbi:MAG: hypothetical protein WC763_05770 [Candidatus Paceibacterota bacterium]|jgi:hypothetical protein